MASSSRSTGRDARPHRPSPGPRQRAGGFPGGRLCVGHPRARDAELPAQWHAGIGTPLRGAATQRVQQDVPLASRRGSDVRPADPPAGAPLAPPGRPYRDAVPPRLQPAGVRVVVPRPCCPRRARRSDDSATSPRKQPACGQVTTRSPSISPRTRTAGRLSTRSRGCSTVQCPCCSTAMPRHSSLPVVTPSTTSIATLQGAC